MQEGRFHLFVLNGLSAGLLQDLTLVLQRGFQLFVLFHIRHHRLLHFPESLLQFSDLVVAVRTGQGLIVVALCDAQCSMSQLAEGQQLPLDEGMAEH